MWLMRLRALITRRPVLQNPRSHGTDVNFMDKSLRTTCIIVGKRLSSHHHVNGLLEG
ncbi:hypothetical protein DPMN_033753 [Dreissena polymorpha]|uniref:Uncharacterized protein n=1 Tax=Dreissena polymorpha TaxID=45954 RepID=A0A9D4M6A4_DREPO|nr:hypothetical protein DPMN_033753 [Dreissena polymorpha]